jgi:hypothetical protein
MLVAGLARAQTTVQVPFSGSATVPAQTVPYSGTVPVVFVCPNGGIPTVSGLIVTCPTVTPPPTVTRTKLFPSGGDDHDAIYAAAAKGPFELSCMTPQMPCTFTHTPLSFPVNTDGLCDDFVNVSDMPSWSSLSPYAVLWQANAANVKLAASADARVDPNACKLTMPNSFAVNSTNTNQSANQYRHAFQVYKATNVSFTGFVITQAGGDSIYIQYSNSVTINGVNSTNPTRNGLSATDGNTNILIEHSRFGGANNLKVAGIADGIDLEPNGTGQGVPSPGDFVNGVTMLDVQTPNNAGDGICFCFWFMAPSTPVTVALTNSQSLNNGLLAFNQNGPAYAGITGSGNTPAFPSTASARKGAIQAAPHKLN